MKSPITNLTAVLTLAFLASSASAAVALKDDLGACKLPHGEVILPLVGSPEAVKGDLLKLSDGSLAQVPSPEQKRTAMAMAITEKNLGDLQFLPDDKGTLWAVSGRIVDLGIRYLCEPGGVATKLDRPALIPGNSKLPAGLLPEIQEGRTYLIETTDGHYALVRILSLTKNSVSLQYVYQPAGTTAFEIPEAEPIELKGKPLTPTAPADPADPSAPTAPVTNTVPASEPPAPAVIGSTGAPGSMVLRIGNTPPPAATILEPYLSTHLKQREMLIQTRLKTVRASATTQAEIDKKIDAMNDLVLLRAGDEAADVLAEQITFTNAKDPAQEFQDSVHPAFAALKKLGKPATHAALKALRLIDPADKQQDPLYKASLLGLVIRSVEGDVVGEFILRQEKEATPDPARRALYDQIISPRKE
jgi:hypothetical protein